MAVHYYRPDFTEGQAKSLIRDMVEDLSEFTLAEVDGSIKAYRRDPDSRFFPTSGQLRGPILAARAERAKAVREAGRHTGAMPAFLRPCMWWAQRPYLWQPDWKEADIPEDHQPAFRRRLAYHRKLGTEGWGVNDFYGHWRKWNKGNA